MIKPTIIAIFLSAFMGHCVASANNLFIYVSPSGQRVVTDRPIDLKGYELEGNRLSPSDAGQSLRYQDTPRNRQLIQRLVSNAAYLYKVDAALINAVIRQESAFQIEAKSSKGAMGLMQLMPATARMYQVTDILDPKQNIYAGTKHLKYLLELYQDTTLALAAYNAGEGAVNRYGGIPPFPETQNYVTRVLKYYQRESS